MVKKLSHGNGALVLEAWKKLSHGNGVVFEEIIPWKWGISTRRLETDLPSPIWQNQLGLSVIRDVGLTYLRSYAILQFLGTNMAFICIVVCFANVTCFQCF